MDASYCTFEGGDVPIEDGIYPDPLPGGYKGPESCGIIPPPHVISTSYGSNEFSVSVKYANRQCYEYGKMGCPQDPALSIHYYVRVSLRYTACTHLAWRDI